MNKIFNSFKTRAAMVGAPVALGLGTVTAFASGDPLPTIAITQDMLTPIVQSVVSNLGVILPVGIVLFGVLLGVKLVPRIIGYFIK